MAIGGVRLLTKTGGKSGDWSAPPPADIGVTGKSATAASTSRGSTG